MEASRTGQLLECLHFFDSRSLSSCLIDWSGSPVLCGFGEAGIAPPSVDLDGTPFKGRVADE